MIAPISMTEEEFRRASDEELISAYVADGESEAGARAMVAELRKPVLD